MCHHHPEDVQLQGQDDQVHSRILSAEHAALARAERLVAHEEQGQSTDTSK